GAAVLKARGEVLAGLPASGLPGSALGGALPLRAEQSAAGVAAGAAVVGVRERIRTHALAEARSRRTLLCVPAGPARAAVVGLTRSDSEQGRCQARDRHPFLHAVHR